MSTARKLIYISPNLITTSQTLCPLILKHFDSPKVTSAVNINNCTNCLVDLEPAALRTRKFTAVLIASEMREKQDTLQNERPKRQEKFVAEHFKAF
jgi:hypothetical protein